MQKTTKLLLTKIFVLLTVIFCVFALAMGAIGCANEEAKVITGIEVNGTTMIVTYSDESTENITIGKAECGHNAKVLLFAEPILPTYADGEEINADVCRASVYGCAVCDHLFAIYEGHELVEDDPCYTGKVCKYCEFKTDGVDDHNFETFELVQAEGLNVCTDTWFSGKRVCLDCGHTELVAEEALGHEFVNIHVEQYASTTQEAILNGTCTICNKELQVAKLWKLGTAEADTNYVKVIGATQNTGHNATYTYTYEGVDYTVADGLDAHTLIIDDYTAEKYPNVIIMTGETLACNSYASAVYTCEECKKGVNIQIKKEHVLAEEYTSTTATCTTAAVEQWKCTVCEELVPVNASAYGHNYTKLVSITDEYVVDGEKYIDVTLACTRKCNPTDAECGATNKLTKIQNYTKVDPDCSNDGSITYTTADGQTKSITLYANGEHVLDGYTKGTVVNNATLKYEDVTNCAVIYKASGAPATCGEAVDAVFQCKTCGKGVDVTISRQHIEINVTKTSDPDCQNTGTYSYNCQYEDCYAHSTLQTDGVIAKVGHDFDFVSATSTQVTVTCSVETCPYHTATAFAIADTAQERSMTCVDYKAGLTNYDAYTFTADGDSYTVNDNIANDMHKLNGVAVQEGTTFVTGSAGIVELASNLATCQHTGAGYFQCSDCGLGVDVVVQGECVKPANATIYNETATCETDAWSYWLCEYNHVNKVEKIADATKHTFTYDAAQIASGKVTVSCSCGVSFVATLSELNKTVVETCESTTTTWTGTYVSTTNAGFTQSYEITQVVVEEGHEYLQDKNGNDLVCVQIVYDSHGNIVKEGYGYYCTRCNQYFITSWYFPEIA